MQDIKFIEMEALITNYLNNPATKKLTHLSKIRQDSYISIL
jgi:hypothetical protein